jgi:hypothetical protein
MQLLPFSNTDWFGRTTGFAAKPPSPELIASADEATYYQMYLQVRQQYSADTGYSLRAYSGSPLMYVTIEHPPEDLEFMQYLERQFPDYDGSEVVLFPRALTDVALRQVPCIPVRVP